MSTKVSRQYKALREADLAKWQVTFWMVKRKPIQRGANYSVLRVDIDAKLAKRLRAYVRSQVQGKDFHLAQYEFSNADTDDVLLTLESGITDFAKIEDAISQVESAVSEGFKNARVTSYDQLLNSWAYVVEFEQGSERIFAWRKISAMTQPKAVQSTKALIWQNQKLTDVDDKEVFLIDPHFDFFVMGGTTFIVHKRNFESAMNFREGMKTHGAEILDHFEDAGIIENVEAVRQYVGDNLHHLRKLASIRKAGYYKQPNFLKRLIQVNASENWGLTVKGGKVVATPETMDLLLKLLNNDRLRSPINDELFDSAAKTKVSS